jgi:uncharacterized protein (DUF58 family)
MAKTGLQLNRNHPRIKVGLTREGWQFSFMLGFIIFAAILQDINLLILTSGAFAGLLLMQWRLSKRSLVGLRIKRIFPETIESRRAVRVELEVSNPRRWLGSWFLTLQESISRETRDGQPSDDPICEVDCMIVALPPDHTRTVSYECRFARRGAYRFDAVNVSTLFPFSLMRGSSIVGQLDRIVVHPRRGKLTSDWMGQLGLLSVGRDARRRSERIGVDGDFFSLREYRMGDAPKLIHWRTSAKRNTLLVRQMERVDHQSIIVILDLFRDEEASETAAEVVVTILAQLVGTNESVSFGIVGKEENLRSIRNREQLREAFDEVAFAETLQGDEWPAFSSRISSSIQASDAALIISTRCSPIDEPKASHSLLEEAQSSSLPSVSPVTKETAKFRWLDVRSNKFSKIFSAG